MKKNNTIKNMALITGMGGLTMAGWLYLRKNKISMDKIKSMVKDYAKKTYDKLDDAM